MVSQRQRVARKRYKEAHPELFPKPEPTPPKDPDKKKKKKSTFKRKRNESNKNLEYGEPKKRPHIKGSKHPLRVPGMKPGDGCYICKARDHIAKLCPTKSEWDKNKTCLICRKRGHSLRNCPYKSDESLSKKLCYNCGETDHSLANCPYPLQDGGTKFASCFICSKPGHLSKNCPQNTHGIYPKGGCCKVCGSVAHLVKDCPDKGNIYSAKTNNERTRLVIPASLFVFSFSVLCLLSRISISIGLFGCQAHGSGQNCHSIDMKAKHCFAHYTEQILANTIRPFANLSFDF